MSAPRTRDRLMITLFAVSQVATTVGAIIVPTLLAYGPLVLIAASPLGRHLVIAAAETPMPIFVTVVLARRSWDSVIGFHAGRAYGERGLVWLEQHSPSTGRWTRRIERLFQRAAIPVVFVVPGLWMGFLAGTAEMRRRVFLPVALLGHITWACGAYLAGEALSPWLELVIAYVRDNALVLTAASVLACGLFVWLRRRT